MEHIIHIATDDKFINSAYWQFEQVYPGQNTFYLLVDNAEKPLRYVAPQEHMHLVENKISALKKLPQRFGNTPLLCFHGMDYHSAIVLNNTPKKQPILWMLWGFEVHNNPYFSSDAQVLGTESRAYFLLNRKERMKNAFKRMFRSGWYRLKNNTYSQFGEMTRALKKTDYCGVLFQEEFDVIKEKVGTPLKPFIFSYYPIENMVSDPDARVSGNNILLGNSATVTNNHLEAFEVLRRFELEDRKIITPLSYGDERYKEAIVKKGKTLLGSNFTPLIDFMPLHAYNTYLQQCGIVIMNHYRQQAVGNVLTLLWMGAKVFLDERNTLYAYLKRLGIAVFSSSKDLDPQNPECLDVLPTPMGDKNRAILKLHINKEILLEQLKNELASIL